MAGVCRQVPSVGPGSIRYFIYICKSSIFKGDMKQYRKTYRSETKITECACSASWIEEEVGGFDVAMDNSSGMNVTECTEHAT